MYYSLDNPSIELRKAILKKAFEYNGGVPKNIAISELISENGVSPENRNVFCQCIDKESEILITENQLTIDNSRGLNLFMLTPLSDLSGIKKFK